MARRKKRSKAAAAAKLREKERSPMITEKSLPALPPNVMSNTAFTEGRADPESDTPTELSPRPRFGTRPTDTSSRGLSSRTERSPERQTETSAKTEGLGLPATTYRNNRNSTIISTDTVGDAGDSFFIPVALDPSPGPSAPTRTASDSTRDPSKRKDYFSSKPNNGDKRNDSTSSTPHIAFQEKGRRPSDEVSQLKQSSRKASRSSPAVDEPAARPSTSRKQSAQDSFKLQEAPKTRQPHTSRSSSEQSSPPQEATPARPTGPPPPRPEREDSTNRVYNDGQKTNENAPPPRASQDGDVVDEEPTGASDNTSKATKPITRKEVPTSRNRKYLKA